MKMCILNTLWKKVSVNPKYKGIHGLFLAQKLVQKWIWSSEILFKEQGENCFFWVHKVSNFVWQISDKQKKLLMGFP